MRHHRIVLLILALFAPCSHAQQDLMSGYLGVPNERVPNEYGAGFSMYVAAWPLLETYPGSRFQTGLFGTWMFAQEADPKPEERAYSDIEGGLGWWRDTRFATTTPKFIMGGVALNFSAWANGPGAGKGRDWKKPQGKYAVAQLSPWIIWPPDGLNLKQGLCGELFGYGYLPLPLTEPRTLEVDGKTIPCGNQCWTLFLNTANFKGPVTFFLPSFFARSAADRPELHGMLLDSRASNPNRALQMETQYIPSAARTDESGKTFARVGRTYFPADEDGHSILVHRITSYDRSALWDSVARWFGGGEAATGRVADSGAHLHRFTGKGWSSWNIRHAGSEADEKPPVAWKQFATPFAPDPHTFAYRWDRELVDHDAEKTRGRVVLPRYYELEEQNEKPVWLPRAAEEVTNREELDPLTLEDARTPAKPYVTPPDGIWKTPGPVAGPFEAYPGDGSVVTYSWYRFVDQPAILNAGFNEEEREALQKRVEEIHRRWTKEREYLTPPSRGTLASLDPAMIVEPPKGFEIGYVPIVTRQAPREER